MEANRSRHCRSGVGEGGFVSAGAEPQPGRSARASRGRSMAHRPGCHTFLNFHNRQSFCWK